MNRYESDAMWKLYQQSNEGVAIQSTVGRVKKSLKSTDIGVHIGRINYIDYDRDEVKDTNLLTFSYIKRKSFEHERELRLTITYTPKEAFANPNDYKCPKNIRVVDLYGIYVNVELDILVSKVYLNPNSQDWLYGLVQALLNRYNFKFPIVKSDLNKLPLF